MARTGYAPLRASQNYPSLCSFFRFYFQLSLADKTAYLSFWQSDNETGWKRKKVAGADGDDGDDDDEKDEKQSIA